MARLVDYGTAADMLGVPVGTLRRWVCERRIPFVKMHEGRNGHVRFDVADLDRWVDAHKVPARSA